MNSEDFKNLHFQLSKEDIRRLDKWKNSRGMKSRSEAIRSMIRIVTKDNSLEEVLNKNSFSDKNDSEYIAKISNPRQDQLPKDVLREIIREEILKILSENKSK